MRDLPHDEAMAILLSADPAYASQLIVDVGCSGDPAELAVLLRHLIKALGPDEGGKPDSSTRDFWSKWGSFIPDKKLFEAAVECLCSQSRAGG